MALIGTPMTDDQERLVVEAVGDNGKVALMFNSDKAGRSGSQDALTTLVSQIYVKLIRLGEKGLQTESLLKEKIKMFWGGSCLEVGRKKALELSRAFNFICQRGSTYFS